MTRDEILAKEMKIAEEIFGTENDPDQIPITQESVARLDRLCDKQGRSLLKLNLIFLL